MGRQRILILDDNEEVLDIVQEVLAYENFEVMTVMEAKSFMKAARQFDPQLLLLDFKLPDGDGGEICRAFKSDPTFRDIPVIMFSAYIRPGLDFKVYGCDAVIAKPFDLDEFIDIVRRHLPVRE